MIEKNQYEIEKLDKHESSDLEESLNNNHLNSVESNESTPFK